MIEQVPVPTPEDAVQAMADTFSPGGMVNKFIIVAEIIDEEGGRAVWTASQGGATRWDNYGLLTEALENEKAEHADRVFTEAAEATEDDDG